MRVLLQWPLIRLILLFVQNNTQAANYSYRADIGEYGVRNGSNDFSLNISLQARGNRFSQAQ